jgi:3-dehydroquinate dehydratase-2
MTQPSVSKNIVWVINGPNLNRLGMREPSIYGSETLDELTAELTSKAGGLGIELECRQSNHEGQLIDWLQEAANAGANAVILNAGGYTHTSVALRDAIAAISIPVIEVHLSNIYAREPFRRRSFLAPVVTGAIMGFGKQSYVLALHAAAQI